ncbi:MAG: [protein-PII] uridylyltransferase [Desulfomonile sp.]
MRFIFADHDRSAQIQRIRDGIASYRSEEASDRKICRMHPVYDELLVQLAENFLGYWKDSIAVVGLGGYGRKEMSPHSDIDILFLRPEDAPEGVYRGIRSMLYMLWDSRVELGHSVRTVQECRQEAEKDLAVLTSLLDVRLIWGAKEIFRDLLIQTKGMVQEADPLDLYLRIEAEILKSSKKFGHTIYLLEPHLKEGPGSLRYIQLIGWLARIIFGCNSIDDLSVAGVCSPRAVEEVKEAMSFLAEVRAGLHFLAGRRDDRLKFDAQSILADQMGFIDTSERRAVEGLMREYYRHAAILDFFGRRIRAKARLFLRPKIASEVKRLKLDEFFYIGSGGINHFSPDIFARDPKEMLNAFRKIAATGCDLDIRLVDLIRGRLEFVNEELQRDPGANSLFLDIFRTKGSVARALNAMMKIGFLERFITEFQWIRFLPQHDVYHQYTVDLHTVAVLENIDSFGSSDSNREDILLHTIFSRLEKPEVLYLAGLFHDIAKGRGPGHEVRGVEIALPVLERLGLPPESIDEVCFLIRNHLSMTHLAFKKDLHDEPLVNRFAENVMHKRRLDLLMLLTHADLRAVGFTAFNSWRKMLLEELYYRTLDVIEGEGMEGEDLADWIGQIKSVVRELVPVNCRGPELEEFLCLAGSRYFLDFYPGVIAEHYVDLQSYLKEHDQISLEPGDVIAGKVDHIRPGYSSITLITRERRGLFFRIAGSLSANRINILSAWSHSIGDVVVATLHVNDMPEGPLDDPNRWEHFLLDFRRVMRGEADVDALVAARRQAGGFIGNSSRPRFPLKVEIDNAASDRATIVEVYAHDRPGLLYDITRQLFSIGLNIILTKITTEVDQAADIFYVHDEKGLKIIDFDLLNSIKKSLHDHLVEMEDAHFINRAEAAL